MASFLVTLTATFCLGLLTTQALPTSGVDSHVTSGGSGRSAGAGAAAASERGLQPMASGSALQGLKSVTKRDISINQDLRTLANMLLTQEYNRIQSHRKNREFLRKIGKRNGAEEGDGLGDSSSSSSSHGESRGNRDEDFDGVDVGDVLNLMPWEPFGGESWSRW